MLIHRLLGGVSPLVMFAPETGAGAGAAAAAAAGDAGGGAAAPGAAAPAAAAAGSGADKTLAGGAEGGAGPGAAAVAAAKAPFGEKWREDLAGDDKDALKDLAKYTDPKAVYKSLRDVQTKISKGELKAPAQPLPENATDAQKTEWRKSNGLPETAEAMVKGLALPDGLVVGEADKPLVDKFAQQLFEKGGTQDEMNRAVSFYYGMQDEAKAQQAEGDGQLKVDTEVALRGEWGGDFKGNMNALASIRALMPQEVQTAIFAARTEDGRLLGNTPELIKWAAELGRQLNPAATLIPAGGGDKGITIASEITSIEATMSKAMSGDQQAHREYYGHDGKPGLEARYRDLVNAQEQMKARGGKAA